MGHLFLKQSEETGELSFEAVPNSGMQAPHTAGFVISVRESSHESKEVFMFQE